MKKILFLHGFASSGHNGTAIMLREQLYADGVTVIAPDIPVMPAEAMPFLRQLVADEAPDLIVTASMGGLYGEQLRGIPRILINPRVHDGEKPDVRRHGTPRIFQQTPRRREGV